MQTRCGADRTGWCCTCGIRAYAVGAPCANAFWYRYLIKDLVRLQRDQIYATQATGAQVVAPRRKWTSKVAAQGVTGRLCSPTAHSATAVRSAAICPWLPAGRKSETTPRRKEQHSCQRLSRAPIIRPELTFETPRVSEYFNGRELAMLTGQPERSFAAMPCKNRNNALDAAESVGVMPELSFEIGTSDGLLTISATDNGPGIPPELIEKVLDFSIRASDKAAYRSPTRGAQGNALKTVIGIPHALGGQDPVIIEGRGVRHTIRAWLDPANELPVVHDSRRSTRKAGTRVSVTVPAQCQSFDPLDWARAISLFNPHALVKIAVSEPPANHAQPHPEARVSETYKPLVNPHPEAWTKWLPSDPFRRTGMTRSRCGG